MGYIRVPVETNPETLTQEMFSYIQIQSPGWVPADGNLDVWIIRAVAAKAAENRSLASDVPDDIFGTMGASLFAIPPVDAVPASGNTTWVMADTLGHTIPAGTFVGIRNANGDLVSFYTVADVVVPVGASTTAVGQVLIQAVDPGVVSNALTGNVELISVLSWVSAISTTAPTSGGTDAESIGDYLDRLSRKLQGLSTVPILAPDFARAALEADPGVFRAVAIDNYNPYSNLLTANQASAETDASGWINVSNATVASSSAQAAAGTKSVSLTAIAAATMQAGLSPYTTMPITPGQTITGRADFRTAVTARQCRVYCTWYNSGGGVISYSNGAFVTDSTSAWTTATVTAVAVAGAAYVGLLVEVASPGAGEVHYVDKMSLRHGSGTDWVAGGTPEYGNARMVTVAAVDANGNAVSSGVKTTIGTYLNARREQNFIVNVVDPRYTNIDVAASFKTATGYTAATVQTSVVAALTAYLSPANWGIDPTSSGSDQLRTWIEQPTVYYNELITLVSNVVGVDRVTDLTVNIHGNAATRADVAIDSPTGLTTAGTITATEV